MKEYKKEWYRRNREQILLKRKEYYYNNKERIAMYNSSEEHKIKRREQERLRRLNPEIAKKLNEKSKQYRKNKRDIRSPEQIQKRKDVNKKYRNSIRQQIIEAYGGKCEVCGISELRFLTLDHSLQNGGEHRKRVGGTTKVYVDIIRRNFPKDEGYRVLCWNHNCGGAY